MQIINLGLSLISNSITFFQKLEFNMTKVVEKVSKRGKKEPKYSKETYLKWYETMLRIRRFEEKSLQNIELPVIKKSYLSNK